MNKNQIKNPPIGFNFKRHELPQLGATHDFLSQLQQHKVKFNWDTVHSSKLRSTQGEFNHDIIHSIIHNPQPVKSSIVISSDNYVIDGHHRWAADYNMNRHTNAVRVHLPALELIRMAKKFPTTTSIDINHVKKAIKEAAREARNRIL